MALSTQMKALNALYKILEGDGKHALPVTNCPKPNYVPQKPILLPRCSPENEGISSHKLTNFYKEISACSNAHSILVARNGHVIAEGYFSPFRQNVWQTVHSISKTFTSTAVGMAIEEGLFKLDDKICDYFPDKIGLFAPAHLRLITVRHLLTMTSGITFNEVHEAVEEDWLKGIFSSSIAFKPGTKFVYNSMNSYLLAALIQRTSKQSLFEYLTPRLFTPLNFSSHAWETCPNNIEKGGWGLYVTIEDIAKLGLLYLQYGRYKTDDGEFKQLLPEHWVRAATAKHISADENSSYGYQIWVDEETNCIVMSGMFGQYAVYSYANNTLVVMTAGDPHLFATSPSFSIIKKYFFNDEILPERLPENPTANSLLNLTLSSLCFKKTQDATLIKTKNSSLITKNNSRISYRQRPKLNAGFPKEANLFCDKTWEFQENSAGILPIVAQAMSNNFTSGLKTLQINKSFNCFAINWVEQDDTFSFSAGFKTPIETTISIGSETYIIAVSAIIKANEDDEPVLILNVCFLEHSSSRKIKILLNNDNILLSFEETPEFTLVIERLLNPNFSAIEKTASPKNSLREKLFPVNITELQLKQLSSPKIEGTLLNE